MSAAAPESDLRSIPARAGEPPAGGSFPRARQVYPRACGGTGNAFVYGNARVGLSPRVRGNLRGGKPFSHSAGSIPARAGEPRMSGCRFTAGKVYPRACGGTRSAKSRRPWRRGLSPRVRGNPVRRIAQGSPERSIPARAGEPATRGCQATRMWVYPRACGGTAAGPVGPSRRSGLSPRVRGNRRCGGAWRRGAGSIPARAGEPDVYGRDGFDQWVYPRACGGTVGTFTRCTWTPGLSPRVRGNPGHPGYAVHPRGSIPARAGEPGRATARLWRMRVYPRACGGT